jgi:hypothetical protein
MGVNQRRPRGSEFRFNRTAPAAETKREPLAGALRDDHFLQPGHDLAFVFKSDNDRPPASQCGCLVLNEALRGVEHGAPKNRRDWLFIPLARGHKLWSTAGRADTSRK